MTLVVVQASNLFRICEFSNVKGTYKTKDVWVLFFCHKWERCISFLGEVNHSDFLYFNGMAKEISAINICMRVLTVDNSRNKQSVIFFF